MDSKETANGCFLIIQSSTSSLLPILNSLLLRRLQMCIVLRYGPKHKLLWIFGASFHNKIHVRIFHRCNGYKAASCVEGWA